MNPALYFLFFALWGVGLAGTGYWIRIPFTFYCGTLIFIINILQFAYWYSIVLRCL